MFSKVKQHISNNRGKYGTAVGAGAAYGASQIPTVADNVPILANQAIYNGMVKGNNLLQSGKEAIGMNAGPKVNQDEIDMVNGYYNSPLAKVYNPTPGQMIQAGNSTNEFINDTKDNYNNATGYVVDKYNQAKDYIGESTMYQNTINIKEALLEGYTAQEIVEAVHDYSQKQRDTFIRRGIEATNKVNGKQFATGLAPVAGAIVGGAIGNQIHGDDGTIGGVTFDEQLNNDDEFDGTGALVGLAAGGLANHLVNSPNSSKTLNRLKNITQTVPSPEERHSAKEYAPIVKTGNAIIKGLDIGYGLKYKMQR